MWQGMAHGIALGPIGSSVAGALSKTVFKEADNGNSTGFFFSGNILADVMDGGKASSVSQEKNRKICRVCALEIENSFNTTDEGNNLLFPK